MKKHFAASGRRSFFHLAAAAAVTLSSVAAVQAAQMKFDDLDNEPTTYMGKLTYVRNFWDIGRTGFALQYSRYEDFYVDGTDYKLYGVGVSQNIDRLGTEVYAGITQNDFTIPNYDVNDMTVYQVGAMVRF